MPGRGSKGNLDPSPGPRPGARGIAAAGPGDPAVPPDFAGGGDWRNDAGGAAPFHGRRRCSSGVRDHSARRSGMPRHTRQPHKTAVAEPILRVPPCPPAGGTRQRRRLRGTFKPRLGLWPRRSQILEPRRAMARFLSASTTQYNLRMFQLMIGRMIRACGTDDAAGSARVQISTLSYDR
jgi:hypothetical protein